MKNKLKIILVLFTILVIVISIYYNPKEVKADDEVITHNCFVDIKGAINNPGVYEIECNKRVIDVINLAGGLTDNADTTILNLSKKVKDEMYIIIYTNDQIKEYKEKSLPSKEIIKKVEEKIICPDNSNDACEKSNASKEEVKVTGKVNINTATKEELMTLIGIGESKADKIIEYRKSNIFNSIEDIKNVSGIGESIYTKIKDNITTE
ncbi:MAG: helix-hairpin-helix domain-containing protein [Bacilli bacterium]|nr:helix-hairpin-helix domain-containing protein [Bacilli bacterium]